ncbi:MAG: arginine N-succinyltransferase [Phycisphaerales bacterium JB059]
MYRVRQASASDTDALFSLAQTGNFINLPPFREAIDELLRVSDRSFSRVASGNPPPTDHDRTHDNYMLVLEGEDQRCWGTSAIRGGMIARDHPNLSYQLVRLVRESTLLSKTIHGPKDPAAEDDRMIVSGRMEHIYCVLFQDTASPTELGGNVMRHELRGRGLGKLLSFSRFHYLKSHPEWFSDRLLAEMMAPIDRYNDGTPFWRHVIRKFINMTYEDADRLSTHKDKREFMYALLPKLVNLSLLDDVVLNSMGEVNVGTRPAAEMLRDIGFAETHRVDPFDGGPHLETRLSEIKALRCETREVIDTQRETETSDLLVSAETERYGFVAVRVRASLAGSGGIELPPEAVRALGVQPGDRVMVSPMRFVPDRRPTPEIPTINMPEEIRRRESGLRGKRLAALSIGDLASIVQDRLDEIIESLKDEKDRTA